MKQVRPMVICGRTSITFRTIERGRTIVRLCPRTRFLPYSLRYRWNFILFRLYDSCALLCARARVRIVSRQHFFRVDDSVFRSSDAILQRQNMVHGYDFIEPRQTEKLWQKEIFLLVNGFRKEVYAVCTHEKYRIKYFGRIAVYTGHTSFS